MMNVPCSVIQGKLPRNTVCSRISPVSRLVKATFTFTGTSYERSFSRHSVSDTTGSPIVYSPRLTSSRSE